jgi:hypothetical protein
MVNPLQEKSSSKEQLNGSKSHLYETKLNQLLYLEGDRLRARNLKSRT